MKKEITDRIRLLGGNVANLKGNSLKEDLCAITFDTPCSLNRWTRPGWLPKIQSRLKVWAIGWMRTWNYSILTEKHFIKKMVDTYYTLDEEPRGQLFWVAKPFTPFQKGTQDFERME
mgnify:CR=1 FL=1